MPDATRPAILCIDDDADMIALTQRWLARAGYDVSCAHDGSQALSIVGMVNPDLVLLDLQMPGLNGFEVCARLQENPATAYIPVVFLTSVREEQSKARAFALGAVDFLNKPIDKDVLLDKVRTHLQTTERWRSLRQPPTPWHEKVQPGAFIAFKEFLFGELGFDVEKRYAFSKLTPPDLYARVADLGISTTRMAGYIAAYLGVRQVLDLDPEQVELGILPRMYCMANRVIPFHAMDGGCMYVLSNPFESDVMNTLSRFADVNESSRLAIAEPQTIDLAFTMDDMHTSIRDEKPGATDQGDAVAAPPPPHSAAAIAAGEAAGERIVAMTSNLLEVAVVERASDIHIEPKEGCTTIRYRVDGDMRDIFSIPPDTAVKIISRLKVLADLDISEKRLPQDGAFGTTINGRSFTARVATSSTPLGEMVVMRLLEPYSKPKELRDLGFTDDQARVLEEIAATSQGLLVVVGTTGSGKTTTIRSLLHKTNYHTRSVMTVEDPVEYRIPFATQQQVNEKADLTFARVLKSSVRQDPDILFLGETRDKESAQIAVDFVSTGHFTITSLHTVNATTALFRLERLGVSRAVMADTIAAIVAQKLLKVLCPYCKQVGPITPEERAMLARFTKDIPDEVARPSGCPQCRKTGYIGRRVIAEVLRFDADIAEIARADKSARDIRAFVRQRGDVLIADAAIQNVRELLMAPADVNRQVLMDELRFEPTAAMTPDMPPAPHATGPTILMADHDVAHRRLMAQALGRAGMRVVQVETVADALDKLHDHPFDLIIARASPAQADGHALLFILGQKNMLTPVLLLVRKGDESTDAASLASGPVACLTMPFEPEALVGKAREMVHSS